jgi:hypothetical protein
MAQCNLAQGDFTLDQVLHTIQNAHTLDLQILLPPYAGEMTDWGYRAETWQQLSSLSVSNSGVVTLRSHLQETNPYQL